MATLKPPLGKSLLPSRLPAINKRPASNVSENDASKRPKMATSANDVSAPDNQRSALPNKFLQAINSKLSNKKEPSKPPAVKMVRSNSASELMSKTSQKIVPQSQRQPLAVANKVPAAIPAAKKRAAWDVSGRLADLEVRMTDQIEKNDHLNSRIEELEAQKRHLEGAVVQKEEQTTAVSLEVEQLRKALRQQEEESAETHRKLRREMDDCQRKLQREIEELQFEKSSVERQKQQLSSELDVALETVAGLKSSVASLTTAQATISAELSATKASLDSAIELGRLKDQTIASLRNTVSNLESTVAETNQKLREGESMRRKLHNTIQELKGNIRVFCRVRPLLPDEISSCGSDQSPDHMQFPADGATLELEKIASIDPSETIGGLKKGNKYEFRFDVVFPPQTSQQTVFNEISQLVQSALDGYNVCIFAYGQTGSGKTYTMEGPKNPNNETEGMIPRAVTQVFVTAMELEEKGWKYTFEASMLEIYNETIRDLLGNGEDEGKHEIRLASPNSNEIYVTDLTQIVVTNSEEIHRLLKQAAKGRAVAETKCNERSSRSHSVFRLKICGKNDITGESCTGILNLIDLAGSERLKESGSQGARLKETQAINKSLANLGNVIMALANKDQHIPYRNSKLTHLLQNCLGGNSKTLMFLNINPREDCFSETLNSLRFATKVNNCNIGTAQKRIK